MIPFAGVLQRCLDEVLAKKKRTRYWLAKETGVSEGNLGRLARGETTSIDFEVLERICNSLDCKTGDLLVFVREVEDSKSLERKSRHGRRVRSRSRRS